MSQPEEKEPQSFSDFFTAAIEKLQESVGFNRAKIENRHRNRIAELREAVAKGQRAREFAHANFWTEDLLPWLRKEAGGVKPWRPGDSFDPYSVEANHFYHSGQAALLEKMLKRLTLWTEEGERAEQQIAFETKKIEEARKAVLYR